MNGVPAYAGVVTNPMMLLAIESTRQHLAKYLPTTWGALAHLPGNPAKQMLPIDKPQLLKRWQADCRAAVLQFEAMEGLWWKPIKSPSASDPAGGGGSFELLMPNGKKESLITITRPTPKVLELQAKDVADRAKDRMQPKSEEPSKRDRICEIGVQVVPQYAFWSSVLPLHPERMPRTLELMQLALDVAFIVEQRFKHAMAVPRPHEINPSVCPVLLTPAHASLPSGHSTEAFTIATLMTALLQDDNGTGATLRRLAQRIADNRQVAGLHYAIDTMAGQLLGTVLGEYLAARCRDGSVKAGIFDGTLLDGTEACQETGNPPTLKAVRREDPLKVYHSKQLFWLWHEARLEWGADPDEDKALADADAK